MIVLVSLAVVGGCPQDVVPVDNEEEWSLDGEWRAITPGESSAACVTVEGGRIVEYDQNCDGQLPEMVRNTAAIISGDRVCVGIETDAAEYGILCFAWDLTREENGDLKGTVQHRLAGASMVHESLWVRDE